MSFFIHRYLLFLATWALLQPISRAISSIGQLVQVKVGNDPLTFPTELGKCRPGGTQQMRPVIRIRRLFGQRQFMHRLVPAVGYLRLLPLLTFLSLLPVAVQIITNGVQVAGGSSRVLTLPANRLRRTTNNASMRMSRASSSGHPVRWRSAQTHGRPYCSNSTPNKRGSPWRRAFNSSEMSAAGMRKVF